jgi:hypothetical protein
MQLHFFRKNKRRRKYDGSRNICFRVQILSKITTTIKHSRFVPYSCKTIRPSQSMQHDRIPCDMGHDKTTKIIHCHGLQGCNNNNSSIIHTADTRYNFSIASYIFRFYKRFHLCFYIFRYAIRKH